MPDAARERRRFFLNGRWRFLPDPDDRGASRGWPAGGLPAEAGTVPVPGVWNLAHPGYEGVAWYETRFTPPPEVAGPAAFLAFGGANLLVECWLNGAALGSHEGGYTPFALRCERALRPGQENRLVVRVVDPPLVGQAGGLTGSSGGPAAAGGALTLQETACAKETWYYRTGGIWGDVALETAGPVRIADLYARATPDLSAALVDLEVEADPGGPASAEWSLELRDPDGQTVGLRRGELALRPGVSTLPLRFPLERSRPWEPERPERYRLQAEVRAAGWRDARVLAFGLRFSELRAGRFALNGRWRYLKGVLLQPNYPLGLIVPLDLLATDPEGAAALPPGYRGTSLLDREIAAIRAGGFNLVRVHVRPPVPGFLERADAAGLLVYAETALAWIRPHPRLLERGVREVTATLRLLRNHPSVAVWGLFNENRPAARAVGRELLALARQLDPTRPVIDDSGGSAVDEWAGWGGQTFVQNPRAPEPEPLNDLHVYLAAPLRRSAERWLTTLGQTGRLGPSPGRPVAPAAPPDPSPAEERRGDAPSAEHGWLLLSADGDRLVEGQRGWPLAPGAVLVSELGYGGLPDLEQVAAEFGGLRGPIDAEDVYGWRTSLAEGFAARRLEEVFGDLAGLVRAAQRLQAEGDAEQIDALRRNPRVSGYVVTQLNDAAWELSAGLTDLWRRPKPALEAVRAANAPLRLIVRPRRFAGWVGAELVVRGWLAWDGQPPEYGFVRLDGVDGWRPVPDARSADAGAGCVALGVWRVRLPARPGRQTLLFRLRAPSGELVRTLEVTAVAPAPEPRWPGAALGRRLQRCFPDARRWDGRGTLLLLDAARPPASGALAAIARWVRAGGHAVILDLRPESAGPIGQAFGLELTARPARGSFLGAFHWQRRHRLFAGLPNPGLAGHPYADVLPAYSLDEVAGAGVVAGCLTVAAGRAWRWLADVQTLAFGSGRVTFYQYRPHQVERDDPVGQTLLANLGAWAAEAAR